MTHATAGVADTAASDADGGGALDAVRQVIREEIRRWAHADSSPWLTAAEAANYMRCPESRIRKLTSVRAIPVHREGRRVLYRRDELDTFIKRGGWSG